MDDRRGSVVHALLSALTVSVARKKSLVEVGLGANRANARSQIEQHLGNVRRIEHARDISRLTAHTFGHARQGVKQLSKRFAARPAGADNGGR